MGVVSHASERPIGAETADFFIMVLEGRDAASLEQLREWRDWIRPRLDALKLPTHGLRVGDHDATDVFRARLREAYLRAREQIELVVLDLDRRIQAKEGGR